MAQAYQNAAERIVLFENEPMNKREFRLLLLDPNRVQFDAEHTDLEAIFGGELERTERVALRTQVIDNPGQPVNIGTKILQFFAVNPNQDSLSNPARRNGAVLVEVIEGEELPLYHLNPDEVWHIARGGGFNTTVYLEGIAPAV